MVITSPSFKIIYMDNPKLGINNLIKGGFGNVSLDFYIGYSAWELENYGKEKKPDSRDFGSIWGYIERMTTRIKQSGLSIPIARAPYLMANTKRTDMNGILGDLTEKCINLCGDIGCDCIVVPPLFAGIEREDVWQSNHDYYIRLARVAARKNVMILIPNQLSDFNGHLIRGNCTNPYEAVKWIDDLNAELGCECFGFCMDVGVCNVCGQNMHDFAAIIGRRIKAVILRDNDGLNNTSQLPFTSTYNGQCQTDWLGLIRGLRESGFDGRLLLDYSDSYIAFPIQLRQQFVKIAYEMGGYLKWQLELENVLKKYDKRVLFGAGNMCRNYMKCYGEQYPPLFTCDNNSVMWGTQFEGLEVKPPKALLELPADCAVFICNIYYEEIESQLLEMGITNPIEYFNDEYMPSFYYDRIDVSKREVR